MCSTVVHTQTLQQYEPLGEVGIYMKEIVIQHNGISYTEDDIIQLIDLVMEIVGEEV